MEALQQIVQLDSDTLVLKVPETFMNQQVEVIILNRRELTESIPAAPVDQWATARQIQTTLRNTGRVFSDSTELMRESRDELEKLV